MFNNPPDTNLHSRVCVLGQWHLRQGKKSIDEEWRKYWSYVLRFSFHGCLIFILCSYFFILMLPWLVWARMYRMARLWLHDLGILDWLLTRLDERIFKNEVIAGTNKGQCICIPRIAWMHQVPNGGLLFAVANFLFVCVMGWLSIRVKSKHFPNCVFISEPGVFSWAIICWCFASFIPERTGNSSRRWSVVFQQILLQILSAKKSSVLYKQVL